MDRLLIILLVFITLPGNSVCCCALKPVDAGNESKSCCDAARNLPGDHGDKREERCPCSRHQYAGAISSEVKLLLASNSGSPFEPLPDFCQQAGVIPVSAYPLRLADVLSGASLSQGSGNALLILQCVNRC